MNKIDYLSLDGTKLTTFLTVFEEMSVSRAANRMGVSQSAVSHTLDKLRIVFDDPLFIRDGRGIESTPRARALHAPVGALLDQLKSLTDNRPFDPRTEQMDFTIAANDFPIHLIFPKLLHQLSKKSIYPRIRFIPAGIPSVSILRASRYRMLITPTPPSDADLEKVSLIKAKMEVFYDASVRPPPETFEQFAQSKYVEVRFSDTESSLMALPSLDSSKMNEPEISVPNFSLLTPMIKGTDRITTQIAAMKFGLLKDLSSAPLPFNTETLDLFLVWHSREHNDPAHKWLRKKIIKTAKSITKNTPA